MRRVAITGLGVISPIGNNLEAYWQALAQGKLGIGPLTRFDTANYKAHVAAEVKDFDPRQYMEKAEVQSNDLFSQYGIAAAAQAVADSGIQDTLAPERLAVYFGAGIGGIGAFQEEYRKLLELGPRRVSAHFITKLIANMAASRIAIRYHCAGPCMPAVTACASGASAIGEGLRLIRHGYADGVIAGGSEAAIAEVGIAGFTNMQALSTADDPALASLPFDKRRSGFVIGEGAGALVLEEYEHAKARGAHIYAELVGYGSTCDAYHITAPDPEGAGAARAIRMALAEAAYQPGEAVYVNAHGTGTPLNDVIETKAIKSAFGEEGLANLLVSSSKSMTGHMLGAAGAVEAIAAIMALEKGLIPPTIGLTEPDPECDLDYVALKARPTDCGLALSTSLGFGGHNACLALRKA